MSCTWRASGFGSGDCPAALGSKILDRPRKSRWFVGSCRPQVRGFRSCGEEGVLAARHSLSSQGPADSARCVRWLQPCRDVLPRLRHIQRPGKLPDPLLNTRPVQVWVGLDERLDI